jgi:endoglucanase
MRRFGLILLAALFSLTSAFAEDGFAAAARMHRGLDIAWLPPWVAPTALQTTPAHMKRIRAAGFDTVQLVLSPFAHMDAQLVLDPAWLEGLDDLVGAGLAQGLTVTLLEHDDAGCLKDAELCRRKIDAFWHQIGVRYRAKPAQLLFAITPEPNDVFSPQMWSAELKKTLVVIRATNPARVVLVGIPISQTEDRLEGFVLPQNDHALIAVAHYFLPLEFTHQGADWEPKGKGRKNIVWGSDLDKAALARDFDMYAAWGQAQHRPIFLGAFGAFETAPEADRGRWIASVTRVAEAHNIGWAFWQFDTNFNAYNLTNEHWVMPVLNALVPKEK